MLEVTQKFLQRKKKRKQKHQQGSKRGNATLDEPLMPKCPEAIIAFAFNGMLFHGRLTPNNLSLVHNFNTPGSMNLFQTIQYVLVVHYPRDIDYLLDITIHWINHYSLDSVSLR